MRSMTGFGRGVAEGDGFRVQVEAGSVNRKTLDVQVSLPRGVQALETVCQKLVGVLCKRGRVQLRIEVESTTADSLTLNKESATRLLDQLNHFAAEKNLKGVESVETLTNLPGFWAEASSVETERLQPILEKGMAMALGELQQMRTEEGSHLASVLVGELESIEGLLRDAEPLLNDARSLVEERMHSAVKKVGEAGEEVEQRLLQEIALLSEKADVQEELDRLKGHAEHFREKMQNDGPVGRALDFLCQEMAREFHTLSVKTPHADLNHLALQGKEGVERLREQVQNVE